MFGLFILLVVSLSIADGSRSALAFDTFGDPANSATGAHSFTYRYYSPGSFRYFDNDLSNPGGTSGIYRSRTYDARQQWNTAADGVSLVYNTSSTNWVGWNFQTAAGQVSAAPCGGDGCTLFLDRGMWWDQEFYPSTAERGTSPITGELQVDAYGALVHEMGHWFGLGHGEADGCQVLPNVKARYSPAPTYEMVSMCFDENFPGGPPPSAQRTPSQDDIQGVNDIHASHAGLRGWFTANAELDEGCDSWNSIPDYWMIMKYGSTTTQASHWCGGGIVSLNNNSAVPYPELVQRARGSKVDYDNDRSFRIRARVKARHNFVTPRVVAFVRSPTFGLETKCDPWPGGMPLNVWKTLDCTITLGSSASSWTEYEYGVRVTEKIDIAWIFIRDL